MAHDTMNQFYACMNLPLQERFVEFTRIIDHSIPSKDLQAMFPQLINNIFSNTFNNGWGLRSITYESNKYDYESLASFLEPQGPLFRLCYKLLSDPLLKYNLPLNVLPLDLQMTLERGRCPQFYSDMLQIDPQTMNVVALALNPFDYYIFNFALYLINSQNKSTWDNWNSIYFALSCDYLVHFLPTNPNMPVLPHIPHYTGKVLMAAPLQAANRPLYSPSLLIMPDLTGSTIPNQHNSQSQSRNEVWRSETVLQVFVDIWMSVEQYNPRNIDMYHRNYCTSPVRVRSVRVLVKHLHSFSAKHLSDPAIRSSALRKYARQIMCTRAHHYVKYLVMTWPLDASFRLVLELWLSLIQPWRYVNNNMNQDRLPGSNEVQEEANPFVLDSSYTQFIAENFPTYTNIFQLILPRFTRLDLTAYKNTVMLFRIGKVFCQDHLVPILRNLEKAVIDSGTGVNHTMDTSNNSSNYDQSYMYNGLNLYKWVPIAKQAITEFNLSANSEYQPLWSENMKQFIKEFMVKILLVKENAEKNTKEFEKYILSKNKGVLASIKHWLMIGTSREDDQTLEEYRKVPNYLCLCIQHLSTIFDLNETTIQAPDQLVEENSIDHSSYVNATNFPLLITNKLRSKSSNVQYMGNPDLMPIATYESTILVRMLYQITTKFNEMYEEKLTRLWNRCDFWGFVIREILQAPCSIQTYVKDSTNHQNIVKQNLPPRLSLRRLGSHAFVIWITIGYILFRFFSCSGLLYIFVLLMIWALFILSKASFKMLKVLNQ